MKRKIIVLLALILTLGLLSGCCLSHEWVEADCITPKTCSKCEKTEGEALGHTWIDATCSTPKTCTVCGETEGDVIAHTWADATCTAPKTCTACGETEGEALGHNIQKMESNKGFFTSPCPDCGETPTEEINWELYGPKRLAGLTYNLSTFAEGFTPYAAPEGDCITFNADGTLNARLFETDYTGTWKFGESTGNMLYYSITFADLSYTGMTLASPDESLTLNTKIEGISVMLFYNLPS